ncbi:transcriptional regulator PhoU [uncultured Clostridium sp.]|uniref:Na/Pi cotransporter family protein n=1 Tax=Muricoprocola aceti TaxID=2981772 RepID=A0ABT2SH78_9FIRM|nr:Na/Pi cotransporter family protein [Muricoprocola aceti]MCU6723842.1 Na/Pi cotransporter family protein [Muricoprocola aceti]SCG91752.1 transcriptional regulator PhoU [uncultured Clostridium sp.]
MSINDVSNLFMFIGGLGMFLYGMHAMSGGIQKSAGSKMQELLGILTNNRLVAVLVGAGLTAIIQSSGATTVMVLGFVNAGIMSLPQAVGVIMGANIGTCITAWIVSLGQLGDSFKAISPSLYAPLILGIGVFITVFSKSSKKKTISEILIGLGMLFIGLDYMGSAAKSYMDSPIITNAFMAVGNNPFIGIAVGLIVTVIMQSSSASVGVLQTLAATSGAVTTSAAVFICLGADIGSCMPAVLSSIGAQRNAKRVAAIHLIFNVIGAIVLGTAGFILFRIMPGFAHTAIDSVGISIFHTGAKIVDVIIQFPFAMGLVKLSGLVVREKESDQIAEDNAEKATLRHLDRRILKSPDFAVENAIKEVVHMGEIANENLKDACQAVMSYDKALIDKVLSTEKTINKMEELITEYLVEIENLSLTEKQHELIKNLFYSVSDIERVGDHVENIAELVNVDDPENRIVFTEEAERELSEMMSLVKDSFSCAVQAIGNSNIDQAVLVGKYEERVDDMEDELRDQHIDRMARQLCKPVSGVAFLDILSNLERISDHAYNLAGYVISENEG